MSVNEFPNPVSRNVFSVLVTVGTLIATLVGASGPVAATPATPVASVTAPESGTVYVTQYKAKTVLAIAPDGTQTTVAHLPDNPYGIAISPDATTLYVTEPSGVGTVVAIPTAGGHLRTIATGLYFPYGIAVSPDGQTLYIAENGTVGELVSVPTSGGKAKRLVGGLHFPTGVAASDVAVFTTTNSFTGSLIDLPLDGGGPITLWEGQLCYATAVAVDGGTIYFTEAGTNRLRSFTPATQRLSTVASDLSWPEAIAVHGDRIYSTEYDGSVESVPKSGGVKTVNTHLAEAAYGIAVQP